MNKNFFGFLSFFIFMFIVLNLFSMDIKIKSSIQTDKEKVLLSDFIDTDNEELMEKAKGIIMGYSPAPGKINYISGDYIKLKIKQLKIKESIEVKVSDKVKVERILEKTEKDNANGISEEKKEMKIEIKNSIIVSGDKMYLKDFIETEDAGIIMKIENVMMGFAPAPGELKLIKGDYIKLKLKQIGIGNIEGVSIPYEIKIVRDFQSVEKSEIEKRIEEMIKEKYGEGYYIKVILNDNNKFNIPNGMLNINILGDFLTKKHLGKYSATIEILVDDKVCKKDNINVEVGIVKSVYVLNDDVSKQQLFNPAGVDLKERVFYQENEVRRDFNIENISGRVYKKNSKRGEIISEDYFEKPKRFKKNEMVEITINSDGITIKSEGKALEDGIEGESVSVLNEKSKKIFVGRVTSDGSVVVEIK